jgi:hypothetical protein
MFWRRFGPGKIITEVDKDVLMAQAEIMVRKETGVVDAQLWHDQIMEAIFANVDIFLGKPEWQNALQSTIIPGTDLGDGSEPVVNL